MDGDMNIEDFEEMLKKKGKQVYSVFYPKNDPLGCDETTEIILFEGKYYPLWDGQYSEIIEYHTLEEAIAEFEVGPLNSAVAEVSAEMDTEQLMKLLQWTVYDEDHTVLIDDEWFVVNEQGD